MDFLSEDGILHITMTTTGLMENMQTDVAAFEGWAVAIKTICPDLANKVIIAWEHPSETAQKENKTGVPHYNRFIYRAIRFCENYDWASLNPLDNKAEEYYDKIKNELPRWVVNYPTKDAKEDVEGEEAQLEISLHKFLSEHLQSDHQLPMGLFVDKKSEQNKRTPAGKSQIDLWSLDNNTFTVYELKKDDNIKVGIISELMFYVNVIKDINEEIIKYPEEAVNNKNVRSLEIILEKIPSNKELKVKGVFLANCLHKIITIKQDNLMNLLNNNKRGIQYSHNKFEIVTRIIQP